MSNNKQAVAFLLDCAKRGQTRGEQPPPSISKVSRIFRDHAESSFIPQLVSIGPIHRDDPKLHEFERQKECYLGDLLSRCNTTSEETLEACLQKVNDLLDEIKISYADVIEKYKERILEACLQKVNDLIPQIRASYASCVIEKYNYDELARMMVMDGCFILEFCFKHEEEDEYLPNKMQNNRIAMDLMLLENQIPFVVLQALFDCFMGEQSFTLSKVLDKYLAPYIKLFHSLLPEKNSSNVLDKYLAPCIKLFRSRLPEKKSTTDVHSSSTHDHVLGYMHKHYQLVAAMSSNPIQAQASKLVDEEPAVDAGALRDHTIIELDRSGMKLKPHQEDVWSMTIKFQSSLFACLPWFWSKPTLLMPTLVIHDSTELILRNFIAYEQSFPQDRYYFTSYACAMDKLIDTQEDIAKLVESKVLLNLLVSNQEAADMINNICKTLFVTYFYYTREFKQMDKYYNRCWPMIKRTYFSNPWNAINLLAGIIVFLVTVVAGIFAVLDYFR